MAAIDLILLSAGSSRRFGTKAKKQWLYIDDKPLWLFVADSMKSYNLFANIYIVASKDEKALMQKYCDYPILEGSNERQYSLKNALAFIESPYAMVTDVARSCISQEMIQSLIKHKNEADVIVPTLLVNDTVIYQENTINREDVKLIQTPQLSKTHILQNALQTETLYTDESSAIKAYGGSVKYIPGSKDAHKLTHFLDLQKLPCFKPPRADILCGIGYDIHAFEKHKSMKLCGIEIKSDVGFKAHSDGDVALHALIDALLGAAGAGDIGELFPDTDQTYKDADSKKLLQQVIHLIYSIGFEIVNVDMTLLMQKPKISPYKDAMRESLSTMLDLPKRRVNIKATTGEEMGYIGRGEGAAVQCVCNLRYYDWSTDENIDR